MGTEYDWLAGRDEDGAVVTFTGKVRNHNLGDSVKVKTLMADQNSGFRHLNPL